MTISAVSGSSVLSHLNYESQIRNLEKQKDMLEEKINELKQDAPTDSTSIRQEIPTYQVQIQAIETEIQKLRQQESGLNSNDSQQDSHRDPKRPESKKATYQSVDIKR